MTGWAVLGLESAGVNPLDLDHGDATPISYLAGNIGEITTTGDIERTILVLRGAGLNPRHFQGRDLLSRLLARRGKDGSWGGQVNQTAFGILALRAAGATSGIGRSAAWLRDHQNSDGGWGFAAGAASDADTTGAVLQGLAASASSTGIRRGASYLRSVQRPGRRLPAERRRDQRPVHRVRRPGPGRGGRLTIIGPRGRPLPARLSRLRTGRATATTGTPHRATRLRSGSPARPCWQPTALTSRSGPCPGRRGRRLRCRPPPPRLQARTDRVPGRRSRTRRRRSPRATEPSPPRSPCPRPCPWLQPPRALTMKVGEAFPAG